MNLAINEHLKAILLQQADGLSEYELIGRLRELLPEFDSLCNLQDNLALFQLHFMLFHALYHLRDQWLAEQRGVLEIDSLKIRLHPYHTRVSDALNVDDPLRRYYLDLENFENTGREEVDSMLDRFWQKMIAADEYHGALAVFGLEAGVNFETVRQRYRQLAMELHPDRGGDAESLQRVNRAMAVLRRYYADR